MTAKYDLVSKQLCNLTLLLLAGLKRAVNILTLVNTHFVPVKPGSGKNLLIMSKIYYLKKDQ